MTTYYCPNEGCTGWAMERQVCCDQFGKDDESYHKTLLCPKCRNQWLEFPNRGDPLQRTAFSSDEKPISAWTPDPKNPGPYQGEEYRVIAIDDKSAWVEKETRFMVQGHDPDDHAHDEELEPWELRKENYNLKARIKELEITADVLREEKEELEAHESKHVNAAYKEGYRVAKNHGEVLDPPCPQCHANRCIECQVNDLPESVAKSQAKLLLLRLNQEDLPLPDGLFNTGLEFHLDWDHEFWVIFHEYGRVVLPRYKALGDNWLGDVLGELANMERTDLIPDWNNEPVHGHDRRREKHLREPAGFGFVRGHDWNGDK